MSDRRNQIHIGDIVIRRPNIFAFKEDKDGGAPMQGKVVYIHPRGRFHVVEFGVGSEAVRESFAGSGRP